MTHLRRIRLFATLAVVLAACGTGVVPPSSSPVAAETPSATPSLTPAPTRSFPTLPSFTPFPPLSEQPPGCPNIAAVDFAKVDVTLGSVDEQGNGGSTGISVGRTATALAITRVTERSGLRRSITVTPREIDDDRGQILGGHEFVAFPSSWYEGYQNPLKMVSAEVTLTLLGGSPISLPTRIIPGNENFDQFAISVPDVSGPGSLSFAFVWTDPCFRFEGSHTLEADFVPLSVTSGCVLDGSGFYDQLDELLDGALRIGSKQLQAFAPFNEAKFVLLGNEGIDAFIEYAYDPKDPSVAAEPGSALRIEPASGDITLGKEMRVVVWTRASVAEAVKTYPPDGAVTVFSATSERQVDGSFSLQVPKNAGRYVAAVEITFDSLCSSGTLWFVVNIDAG